MQFVGFSEKALRVVGLDAQEDAGHRDFVVVIIDDDAGGASVALNRPGGRVGNTHALAHHQAGQVRHRLGKIHD